MSKKHHAAAPVPPGNRPQSGPSHQSRNDEELPDQIGTGFNEEDPQRRLGDFTGAGEHARQQPGLLNDGGSRHSEDAG